MFLFLIFYSNEIENFSSATSLPIAANTEEEIIERWPQLKGKKSIEAIPIWSPPTLSLFASSFLVCAEIDLRSQFLEK